MKRLNRIINNRIVFILIIVSVICFILITKLYNLVIINGEIYNKKLEYSHITYYGEEKRRGNIYDRNGKLLVGSKGINVLVFKGNISEYRKASLASLITTNIDIDLPKFNNKYIEDYLLALNKNKYIKLIDNKDKERYENREIDDNEYNNILKTKITDDEKRLTSFKTAYIYYLMNNGYSYSEKIIKDNLTKKEYLFFASLNNDYLYTTIRYKRYYPYKDRLKAIFGSVGKIPYEKKDYYLSKGYNLNDTVGISNLEEEYEEYLKGVREEYYIDQFGNKVITKSSHNGYDLYLTIDIDKQIKVDNIIDKELTKAKNEPNTKYLNKTYVLLSNPNDGSIIVSSSRKLNYNKLIDKYSYIDNSAYIFLDSVTPGSIVKGASHMVGYTTGNLKIGYTVDDSCIKILNTPKKCSWTNLGTINDITALKYSSNYYQFLTAIRVGKGNYIYNGGLSLDKKAFKKYRDMFNSFGLGVKTGIDLPYEGLGYIGNDTNTFSILDFSIGQYDTYTPAMINQYINTLALKGKRYKLHYADKIMDNDKVIYEYKNELLNDLDIDKKYWNRVSTGLKEVLKLGGTGYYFVDPKYKPAGKTGTSESFLDTDLDGYIDTPTITHTFGAYMPYNKPKVSLTVVTPDVGINGKNYISYVNKQISYKVSRIFFEK